MSEAATAHRTLAFPDVAGGCCPLKHGRKFRDRTMTVNRQGCTPLKTMSSRPRGLRTRCRRFRGSLGPLPAVESSRSPVKDEDVHNCRRRTTGGSPRSKRSHSVSYPTHCALFVRNEGQGCSLTGQHGRLWDRCLSDIKQIDTTPSSAVEWYGPWSWSGPTAQCTLEPFRSARQRRALRASAAAD